MGKQGECEDKSDVSKNSSYTNPFYRIPRDIHEYVKMILDGTRMSCLTKNHELHTDNCDFLAANLYCKSIFGEDVVANMCLEKSGDVISGHIRIRTKTQGIAFAIGEKIMLLQRK